MLLLIGLLLLLLVALCIAVTYRLVVLRRGGTAAIMRKLPAVDGHGWRHGLIRYDDEGFTFFKLSSLKLAPDYRVARRDIGLPDRRGPRGDEFDIMSDEIVVLAVDTPERSYEIALDRGALTAFLSWVESRPSGQSLRNRPAS